MILRNKQSRDKINMTEKYECPVCGSSKHVRERAKANIDYSMLSEFAYASRKLPEYMHFHLMECKECELLFSVDIPDLSNLPSNYAMADFDSAKEAFYASETYFNYLKQYIQPFPKSVLDIGTGEGSFLKILLDHGIADVTGVEPSAKAIAAADTGVQIKIINDVFSVGLFSSLNTDSICCSKKFDLITLFQTIEHIPNSTGFLSDMRSLLDEAGSIFIVCHNYKAMTNQLLGRKSPIFDFEHLQIFSPKSIRLLLEKRGYKNIRVITIKNTYPLTYWLRLFPFPHSLKKLLISLVERIGLSEKLLSIPTGNLGVFAAR